MTSAQIDQRRKELQERAIELKKEINDIAISQGKLFAQIEANHKIAEEKENQIREINKKLKGLSS